MADPDRQSTIDSRDAVFRLPIVGRRIVPVIILCGTLSGPAASMAVQVPDPSRCTVAWPAGSRATASPGPLLSNRVTITVRDFGNSPVAGARVKIDFSTCDDFVFGADSLPGQTANCATRSFSAVADAAGICVIHVLGGGCDACPITASAEGIPLSTVSRVASTDMNADGRVDGCDRSALLAQLGGPGPCADLDGNGIVAAPDLAIFDTAFDAGAAILTTCGETILGGKLDGDLTGDDLVDGGDALRLARILAGLATATAADLVLGDVEPGCADGDLDAADLQRLLDFSVGRIPEAQFGFLEVHRTFPVAGFGTLTHPNGATLVLPPGSMPGGGTLTIRRLPSHPLDGETVVSAGPAFTLEPLCFLEEDAIFEQTYYPDSIPMGGSNAQISVASRGLADLEIEHGITPAAHINEGLLGDEARYHASTVDSVTRRVRRSFRQTSHGAPFQPVWDPAVYEPAPPGPELSERMLLGEESPDNNAPKTVKVDWRVVDDACAGLKARIQAAIDKTVADLQKCGIPFCAPKNPYDLTVTLKNVANPDKNHTLAYHQAGALAINCNKIDTGGAAPGALEKIIAHEMTHLFQYFVENDETRKCKSKNEWWIEGGAEALSDKIYDGVKNEYNSNGRNHVTNPKTQGYHASVFIKWLMSKYPGKFEETFTKMKEMTRIANENNKPNANKVDACKILDNALGTSSIGLLPAFFGDLLGTRDWENDETLAGDLWDKYPKDPTKWSTEIEGGSLPLGQKGEFTTLSEQCLNPLAASEATFCASNNAGSKLKVEITGPSAACQPSADDIKCLEIRFYGQKVVAGVPQTPVLLGAHTKPKGQDVRMWTIDNFGAGSDNQYVHVVFINTCDKKVGRIPDATNPRKGTNKIVLKGTFTN